jgi:transposase
MAHGRPRDPRTEQRWRLRIEQWQHSGLSVAAFCARHGLTQASFYAWRRHLRQRATTPTPFLAVQVVPEEDPGSGTTLELVLACGRRLRVPVGFDPVTLRRLLTVLEEGGPC